MGDKKIILVDQNVIQQMVTIRTMMEEAADYLELNSLLVEGQVFIDKHLELIIATEAFKKLSPEKLGDLLGRDSLDVPSEQIVVQSLETWISANPEVRTKSLEDL